MNKKDKMSFKEEKSKSDLGLFVIEGIKIEAERIKSYRYEIEVEEMGVEEDFWPEEKVNCDKDYLSLLNQENLDGLMLLNRSQITSEQKILSTFQIGLSELVDARSTRIPNTDTVIEIKAEIEYVNVKHTKFGSSINDEDHGHVYRKKKHRDLKKFVDDNCDNMKDVCTKKEDLLNLDKRPVQVKLRLYECNDCECSFVRKYQLVKHSVFIHRKEKPFQCLECEYSCCGAEVLRKHIKSVHKILPFKCTKCNYSSGRIRALRKHIATVHGPKTKDMLECAECSNSFTTKSHLKFHILSVHNKLKPFKCVECDYSCSAEYFLNKHIGRVHRKVRPHLCSECDYSCFEKGRLATHINSVHRKERPYKCTECDYSCGINVILKKHIMAVHRKLKPFKCAECDYTCSNSQLLKRHILALHRKLKTIKCPECNYSCSIKAYLVRHINSVHREEKPYKCTECDYCCKQQGNLIGHVKRVHRKPKS